MNDVAYVIAGGPSLEGFPFDALPAGRRIGANKSGWLAGCDTLVTVDRNFHRNFADRLIAFPGEVYVAFSSARETLPGVIYWKHSYVEGFSWASGELRGSTSGFAALNLAVLLGYTEIALLGFDFKWSGGRSHFHDGYPTTRPHADAQLAEWVLAFKPVAPQLTERGINVTNFVGPAGSRLQVFPTRPLEDLL